MVQFANSKLDAKNEMAKWLLQTIMDKIPFLQKTKDLVAVAVFSIKFATKCTATTTTTTHRQAIFFHEITKKKNYNKVFLRSFFFLLF